MKNDSVNFIDDLVKGYSEQAGVDEKLVRRMYDYYVRKIKSRLKDPSTIEIPIRGFGVLFLPMHGAIIAADSKGKSAMKKRISEESADFYRERKKTVEEKVVKCKECGINNVRFLHTLLSRTLVKNS